jgi:hypothetical protein
MAMRVEVFHFFKVLPAAMVSTEFAFYRPADVLQ